MLGQGGEEDFYVEVAGAAGDVERAEGERLAGLEEGRAFEHRLADDWFVDPGDVFVFEQA